MHCSTYKEYIHEYPAVRGCKYFYSIQDFKIQIGKSYFGIYIFQQYRTCIADKLGNFPINTEITLEITRVIHVFQTREFLVFTTRKTHMKISREFHVSKTREYLFAFQISFSRNIHVSDSRDFDQIYPSFAHWAHPPPLYQTPPYCHESVPQPQSQARSAPCCAYCRTNSHHLRECTKAPKKGLCFDCLRRMPSQQCTMPRKG